MFGIGGFLNRLGWDEVDVWYDDFADDLMEIHQDEAGCNGGAIDHFSEYPDIYYCAWCGAEL